MYSDELMELLLAEETVPLPLIHETVRQAVFNQQLTPVFLGSAYRNKGVQPLLDAVVRYLPSPLDCQVKALAHNDHAKSVALAADPEKPTVAMAFKIVEDPYGTLTFMRIYQGRFVKGGTYFNQRNGRKERFSRIVRMHADQREEIDEAVGRRHRGRPGRRRGQRRHLRLGVPPIARCESMYVPEPVIKMAIAPANRDGADRLSKALQRFRREDPTLHVSVDEETGETIMAGMGELHLEIYVERIRREFKVEVEVGAPKVNYREAPTQSAEFNTRHKKQTGGAGQFAHIVGRLDVLPEDAEEPFVFEDEVTGGRVPKQFIPAVEKGFRQCIHKGPVAGYPVVGLQVTLEDGSYHEVDSSDMAFQTCAGRRCGRTSPGPGRCCWSR